MANVLIISPYPLYRRWPTTPDTARIVTNATPLTLPQLAASLPKHKVKIYDGNAYDISLPEYAKLLRWSDIVAINIMSSFAALNTELNVRFIRKVKSEIKIIFGGHHATFQAEEWLSKGVDIVVRREGEITLPEVVDVLVGGKELKKVKGISWHLGGDIIHNPDRPFIENLDSLPMPRWDLMDFGKYHLFLRKKGYSACLETGRGCQEHCTFCQVGPMWNHTHRFKSVNRVMEEMKLLTSQGVTKLFIVDDSYGANVDTARQVDIYKMMRKENFNFEWGGSFRHDYVSLNHKLLKEAAATGLKFACVGFESVEGSDLDLFNKKNISFENLDSYVREYEFLKSLGIFTFGFIVIGYPGQNEDSVMRTLENAHKFCDYPLVTLYKPLPGTVAYSQTKQKGLMTKKMFYHDPFTVAVKGTKPILAKYNRFFLRYLLSPMRLLKGFANKNYRPMETIIFKWFIGGIFKANFKNVGDFFWFIFKGRKLPEDIYIKYLCEKYLSDKNISELVKKAKKAD